MEQSTPTDVHRALAAFGISTFPYSDFGPPVLRWGDAALEETDALGAVPTAASGPVRELEQLARTPLVAEPRTVVLRAFPDPEPGPTAATVAEPTQTPAIESTSTLAADPGLAVPVVAPAPPVQGVATPGVVRFVAVAPPPAVVITATVSSAGFAVPSVPAPSIIVVPTIGSLLLEPAAEPEVPASTAQPEPVAEPLPSPGAPEPETAAAAVVPTTAAESRHGDAPPVPTVHADSGKLALNAMFRLLAQAGTTPQPPPAPGAPHRTHLSGHAAVARGSAGSGGASCS